MNEQILSLEMIIEKKREEMYKAADKWRLKHRIVVHISKELDTLLNQLKKDD